jgi:hypothetical protein
MHSLTLATAFNTPLPPYRDKSPSRSSTASFSPVEAPEGQAAAATWPLSRTTIALTVGLPLESSISIARMSLIFAFMSVFPFSLSTAMINDDPRVFPDSWKAVLPFLPKIPDFPMFP